MIRKLLLVGLLLIAPTLGFTESNPQHPHPVGKESKPERSERQHRDDLERRIQKLEQAYELREPRMPAPDAPAPTGGPR